MSTQTMTPNTPTPVPTSALRLRPAEARGKADHGWLRSAHTFSFANYYDPQHMHFDTLRVINDDYVAGGGGFPPHPHQDAEIFSYVLEGALEHKDTMGNGSIVKAGGVQYMSAGSGVRHSEFNPSRDEAVRFLQIWLLPTERGARPRYETKDIPAADKDGKLALFLSPEGRDGSMAIRSNADIYAATLNGDQSITFDLAPNHKGWVQVARGSLTVNGQDLRRGDGLAIEKSGTLTFEKGDDAEIVFFDFIH
ncbi:pirin family protein [Aquisalinus luteolus]|uniref:Quercetin 2,3-dioxygenase n=2 Tax=Aquisalinus luteolus TaxID=1566827 RepID=A0A8J3A0G5_9PROT|nr:pirin family protein [Aquisalinus luteolus]GGH93210.1 quercetin 2,3-dioxygenase [Aquisalinus luteolus]